MATTAELLVRIGADIKQLQEGLDKADAKTAGFAQSVKKHSKAIGIAMIAIGAVIVGVATKSIMTASNIEEMTAKFETVFADLSGGVKEWAKTTAKAMGRSRFAFMEMAAGLQDTFVPMGIARDKAADLAKKLTVLAVDVASFNNKLDKDVIRDFQSALVGNTETVRKYGIVITAVGVEQEVLRQGWADSKSGITEAMKVQARLNLIMAGTTDAQGDAIRTAGSFANQMKVLKASTEEVFASIGKHLLPTITSLVTKIGGVMGKVGEWAEKNETLVKIIAGAGGLLIVVGGLILILPKLVTAIKTVGVALKTLMLNPIVALVAAIALLGFGIFSLVKHHTDWNKVVEASEKVNEELAKSEGKLTNAVLEAQKAYNELRIGFGQLEPAEAEHLAKSQELIAMWEDGTLALNEQTGALESVAAGLDNTSRAAEEAKSKIDALTGSMKDAVVGAFLFYSTLGRDLTPFEAEQRRALGGVIGIPGLAHGGIVTSPTLAMVGENGPEAVIPLSQMGGLTINFNESVFMEKEESINKLADRIYGVIKRDQRFSFGAARG